jgi:sortase (surface protein transpeptidase)
MIRYRVIALVSCVAFATACTHRASPLTTTTTTVIEKIVPTTVFVPIATIPVSVEPVTDIAAYDQDNAAAAQAEAMVDSKGDTKLGQIATLQMGTMSGPVIADGPDEQEGGSDSRELQRGALLWEAETLDCSASNIILAHRTAGPGLFRKIDTLHVGDRATATRTDGTMCAWKVVSVTLLTAQDAETVVRATQPGTMTASACADKTGAPGGISHRWVVVATGA